MVIPSESSQKLECNRLPSNRSCCQWTSVANDIITNLLTVIWWAHVWGFYKEVPLELELMDGIQEVESSWYCYLHFLPVMHTHTQSNEWSCTHITYNRQQCRRGKHSNNKLTTDYNELHQNDTCVCMYMYMGECRTGWAWTSAWATNYLVSKSSVSVIRAYYLSPLTQMKFRNTRLSCKLLKYQQAKTNHDLA